MAYQSSLGIPRFYINNLEWLYSTGHPVMQTTDYIFSNLFRTLPVKPVTLSSIYHFKIPPVLTDQSFVAILGHDFAITGSRWTIFNRDTGANIPPTPLINCSSYGDAAIQCDNNGFSISTFNGEGKQNIAFNWASDQSYAHSIGSIIIGTYFDMPHSPQFNITMTREMDGVKRTRTRGGNDLINHRYTQPPLWGSQRPWELSNPNQAQPSIIPGRYGRRSWNLSFSYLSESDLFPTSESLGGVITDPGEFGDNDGLINSNTETTETLITSSPGKHTFLSQVMNRTRLQLPFIFQPNKDDNSPDNLAICKFDQNAFSFQQQSLGLMSCKMRIKEVW